MRIVSFTPIKLNSERVPGKNLRPFTNGKPLLTYMLNTLTQVPSLDAAYVYCSDKQIIPYLPAGIRFLKRDRWLDTPQALANDLMRTFAQQVDADIYVMANVTAPFLTAQSIEKGLEKVKSGMYDCALTVTKMQEFLWKGNRPFNYSLEKIPRSQDLEPLFVETTGLYVFTREVLWNRGARIGEKPYLIEVSKLEATDINTPEDFEIADAIFSYKYGRVPAKTCDLGELECPI